MDNIDDYKFKDFRELIISSDMSGFYDDPEYPEFKLQIFSNKHQVNVLDNDSIPVAVFLFCDNEGFCEMTNPTTVKVIPVKNKVFVDWDDPLNILIPLDAKIYPDTNNIPYWDCRFDVNRGEISKWVYCIVKNYKTQLSYKDN